MKIGVSIYCNVVDLFQFIVKSEILEYVLMTWISSLIDLFGFCRSNSTSSAYKLILCIILFYECLQY